jgi:DNA-binding CsgD family transcriptional regulator/PAS domain-containing protein
MYEKGLQTQDLFIKRYQPGIFLLTAFFTTLIMKRERYYLPHLAYISYTANATYAKEPINPYGKLLNDSHPIMEALFEKALSYFFMIDFSKMQYVYISKSISNVLGYSNEAFMNGGLDFAIEIIHPEDKSRLEEIHDKLFQYLYSVPLKERKDLKFAFNLRVKRDDGKYIHLLQETVFLDISTDGHPLCDFSTCTDISSHKKDNNLKLNIFKRKHNSFDQVFEFEVGEQPDLLTNRQIEILNLLSHGFTTNQIAQKLFLSIETVKIHRKNILARTGAKNSTEAVNMILRS